MITGKLEGFEKFDRALTSMPARTEHKVLQKATTDALKPMLSALKAAAPRHVGKQSAASEIYGTIVQNLKLRVVKVKRKGERGASIKTGDAFWSFFLERGTRYISAKPWFSPTVSSNTQETFTLLGDKLGEGIEKVWNER